MCAEHGAKEQLDKEAHDVAMKLASHNKNIRSCERQLQELQELKDSLNGSKVRIERY